MKKILLITFFFIQSASVSYSQVNLNLGLVSHHPFSGNAQDAGPNGINGNVTNATLTTDRAGNTNSAYYFDGSSYISLPFNNAYNFSPQGSFSISVWILPDQNNTWPAQAVVVKAPFQSDFTLSAWNYGIYALNYKAMSGYAYNHILNGSTSFIQNLCWYNIISTYDNGVWNLYVNGQLEDNNSNRTNFILQDGSSRIVFGKKGEANGDWYKGKMDDVRIYNRVLTRDEIDSLAYNSAGTRTVNDVTMCEGNSTQLNATGSTSYSWSPSTGLSNSAIPNPIAAPAVTTRYYVTGTTASGCTSTDNVLVTVNPRPAITINNDTLVCENSSIQLNATGGNQYSWSPATGLSNPLIANPIATALATTRYLVNVTTDMGCTDKDSVLISTRKPGNFTISPDAGVCDKGSIQLSAAGGDMYTWDNPGSLDNINIANPVGSPVQTTTYAVLIRDTVCNLSNNLQTIITVNPLPVITVSKTNDIDCANSDALLTATGAVSYSWTPASSLSDPLTASPVASPADTTSYTVTGADINGCIGSNSITVNVTKLGQSLYLMPSAFTPNGDGINDCYGLRFWGAINELDFSIYNRWGERVFHSKKPDACWNGLYKGTMQDAGVFVYVVKAKTNCGDAYRKGTFILIR